MLTTNSLFQHKDVLRVSGTRLLEANSVTKFVTASDLPCHILNTQAKRRAEMFTDCHLGVC